MSGKNSVKRVKCRSCPAFSCNVKTRRLLVGNCLMIPSLRISHHLANGNLQQKGVLSCQQIFWIHHPTCPITKSSKRHTKFINCRTKSIKRPFTFINRQAKCTKCHVTFIYRRAKSTKWALPFINFREKCTNSRMISTYWLNILTNGRIIWVCSINCVRWVIIEHSFCLQK